MTVGLLAAHANNLLEIYRGSNFTAPSNVYVQLHVGDPGAAGTSNQAAVTTRNTMTWNAASAGSMTRNTSSAYSMTTSETISHVSFWSASAAGTCYRTAALTSSVPVVNGSSFTLTTCTFSYTPIAA